MRDGRDDTTDAARDAAVTLWAGSGPGCSGVLVRPDMVLTAAHCAAATRIGDPWSGVRALAHGDGRLFGVNDQNTLIVTRAFVTEQDLTLQPIGGSTATRLRAMTNAHAGRIYGASTDGTLWVRPATANSEPWTRIGIQQARGIIGLASHGDWLYGCRGDRHLLRRRRGSHDAPWNSVATATRRLTAITSYGNLLFAATGDDRLLAFQLAPFRPTPVIAGHAVGVRSLAATVKRLFAFTTAGRLWRRTPTRYEERWELIGTDPSITTIGGGGNLLFAARSGDGPLYTRPARVEWTAWGDGRDITTLTAAAIGTGPDATASTLYGLTSDGHLVRRTNLQRDAGWETRVPAVGFKGLAGHSSTLYAVNSHDELVTLDTRSTTPNWRPVKPTGNPQLLTIAEPDGEYLYGANVTTNRLVRLPISRLDNTWTDVGHVNDARDLTAAGTTLWVTTGSNLATRPATSSELNWTGIYPVPTHWSDPTRWEQLPSPVEIRIGRNPLSPSLKRTATHFKQAGQADILLLKLATAVPDTIARPMTVWLEDRPPDPRLHPTYTSGYGSAGSVQTMLTRAASLTPQTWTPSERIHDVLTAIAVTMNDIFVSTEHDSRLKVRRRDDPTAEWDDIGEAEQVTAMTITATATSPHLWCVTSHGELWTRPATREVLHWDRVGTRLGDVPDHGRVVTITAHADWLYGATDNDHLVRRPTDTSSVPFAPISHAKSATTAITIVDSHLLLAADAQLWHRPADAADRDLTPGLGDAPQVRALATAGSTVYALSNLDWPIRQIADVTTISYPTRDDITLTSTLRTGRLEPGDSGGPHWQRTTTAAIVYGITQQSGTTAPATATYTTGGALPNGTPLPNVREWLRSAIS